MQWNQSQVLKALEKAVHSGNITAIVPEDLEIEAHNTLWNETKPGQLTLLKLAPSVPATSITHEFTKVTSYGFSRSSGFFGERSLPPESNFSTERVTNQIKLMGEIGPTFLLAHLEKTQRALGTTGAQNIERTALRRNVLWKKNRNMYFADTSTTRLGANSTRFKGLAQQIREGTDGTVGTASRYGSHAVDMGGQPLVVDTIRERLANSFVLFDMFTCLLMDPHARSDFEGSLDSATRLPFPIQSSAYMVGQQVAGIQTQGNTCFFETDTTLSPVYGQGGGQYTTDLEYGAPTGRPTVTAAAGADGSSPDTSAWTADYAGNVYYVVTEMVDEVEGLGTRAPASGTIAVAASEEVTLTITPANPLADSFKVYRGLSTDTADTDAWFIFEVANSGSGSAVTAYDDNLKIPNTSTAFGLNIVGQAERAVHGGLVDSYHRARESSASFLNAPDEPGNTVAIAELGPTMGIMALASILAEVDRPLVYSASTPEVRNPYQNIYFYNIGRAS